jgi:mobilome CxxCx(11)CxxC protein
VVDATWEAVAVLLLVTVALKIVYKWSDKAQAHSRLMGENIAVVGLADDLLAENPETVSPETQRYFRRVAERSEQEDRMVLDSAKKKERQAAYREGLKEFSPATAAATVCPVCNSSPWHFVPGACDACGNTPYQ